MQRENLWPEVPPQGSVADDFCPWLEVYPAATAGPVGGVLICPGGGYGGRAEHEAGPIAAAYNAAGLAAAVVHYRVAPQRHPAPLLDAARALRLLRLRAEEYGLRADKIAVLGFSAGGHLAGSLGVHHHRFGVDQVDRTGCSSRPDALILCYPVLTSGAFTHRGSMLNLLGEAPAAELLDMMSLENQVDAQTPPTFLWHTADDGGVPVENSLGFAQALSRHRVPFELHVYPHGRHGLGLACEDAHVATWQPLSVAWLKGMGW